MKLATLVLENGLDLSSSAEGGLHGGDLAHDRGQIWRIGRISDDGVKVRDAGMLLGTFIACGQMKQQIGEASDSHLSEIIALSGRDAGEVVDQSCQFHGVLGHLVTCPWLDCS